MKAGKARRISREKTMAKELTHFIGGQHVRARPAASRTLSADDR